MIMNMTMNMNMKVGKNLALQHQVSVGFIRTPEYAEMRRDVVEGQPLRDGPHAPVHEQGAHVHARQVFSRRLDARPSQHAELYKHQLPVSEKSGRCMQTTAFYHRKDRERRERRSEHQAVDQKLLVRSLESTITPSNCQDPRYRRSVE